MGPWRDRAYRLAFLLALGILTLSALAGFTHAALTTRGLPSVAQDPLAEARRLLAAGRAQEGRAEFRRALRMYPPNFTFAVEVADGLLKSGDPGAALEVLDQARAMRPASAEVHAHIGFALLEEHRVDEAVAEFSLARRLDPRDAAAAQGMGEALVDRGRYPEAVEMLREAVQLAPDSAPIRNSLGVALALAGRPREAAEVFETALSLGATPEIRANRDRAVAAAAAAR